MSERLTPETDAAIIERRHIHKSDGSVQLIELIEAEFARKLERKRDELREALMKIEEIFINGEDTYLDFVRVGNIARKFLERNKD